MARNSETQPLVSIITPSYNQGQFIEYAIRSIKNQTYSNFEHVIVDGASTDDTLEVIQSHAGSYTMRWVSEPDEGMYDAINKGLRMARGDILAYLNCDDMYFPWSVETAVRHLDTRMMIYGDSIELNMDTGVVDLRIISPFNSAYYRSIGTIIQPTVFFRREVMERIGVFDDTLRNLGDVEYWLRCDAAGFRIGKVNEFLAIERDYAGTLSNRFRDRLNHEKRQIREKYGDWKTRFTLPFTIWRFVYWRAVLLTLKLGGLPGWQQFKCTHLLSLSWRECARRVLPEIIRARLREDTIIDPTSLVAVASGHSERSPDDQQS